MKNKIKIFLKIFYDAIKKIITLEKVLKINRLNGKFSIIWLFYLNTIHLIFKNIYKNKKINIHSTLLNYEKINFNEIAKDLINDGCSKIYKIDNLEIENIKKEIFEDNLENFLIEKKRLMTKENLTRVSIPINLDNNPSLKKIIFSEQFKEFTKSILKTDKITISATLTYSIFANSSKKQKIREGQLFHYDIDFKNQIKFFIYLSDVAFENGPHQYAIKSHYKKNGPLILNRPFDDKVISENYQIKSYEGKSASCFFTDGFGYHRGLPPKTERLVIGIDLGSNFFKYYENDYLYNLKNKDRIFV